MGIRPCLTIFYICEDFDQFSKSMSLHDSKIFSQINCNLLKYPNLCNFFDRTEIFDLFPAIWDLPRGYCFFFIRNGVQIKKASLWKKIWKNCCSFKSEFYLMFCQSSIIYFSNLRFCITKPQYITNIL